MPLEVIENLEGKQAKEINSLDNLEKELLCRYFGSIWKNLFRYNLQFRVIWTWYKNTELEGSSPATFTTGDKIAKK